MAWERLQTGDCQIRAANNVYKQVKLLQTTDWPETTNQGGSLTGLGPQATDPTRTAGGILIGALALAALFAVPSLRAPPASSAQGATCRALAQHCTGPPAGALPLHHAHQHPIHHSVMLRRGAVRGWVNDIGPPFEFALHDRRRAPACTHPLPSADNSTWVQDPGFPAAELLLHSQECQGWCTPRWATANPSEPGPLFGCHGFSSCHRSPPQCG